MCVIRQSVVAVLLFLLPTLAAAAQAPAAGHVRLVGQALRLQVNDFPTRWQFRLQVTVTAPDEAALADAAQAILQVRNPAGTYVELLPRRAEVFPKRFKAANARLQFRAVEDSSAPSQSNLPEGFCEPPGLFSFKLRLQGEVYTGEFSFTEPQQMQAIQPHNGRLQVVRNYCIASELPLTITTEPSEFGPVYYKRQDMKNFVFQLANIDDALTSGTYYAPIESPQYILQVRVGDATGAMALLDPSSYIRGHSSFLIRSDWTQTPLEFSPADLAGHKAVMVDFIRTDTPEPNQGFTGPGAAGEGWSGQLEVQDRVLLALYMDDPPSEGELLQATGKAVLEDEAPASPIQRGWRQ